MAITFRGTIFEYNELQKFIENNLPYISIIDNIPYLNGDGLLDDNISLKFFRLMFEYIETNDAFDSKLNNYMNIHYKYYLKIQCNWIKDFNYFSYLASKTVDFDNIIIVTLSKLLSSDKFLKDFFKFEEFKDLKEYIVPKNNNRGIKINLDNQRYFTGSVNKFIRYYYPNSFIIGIHIGNGKNICMYEDKSEICIDKKYNVIKIKGIYPFNKIIDGMIEYICDEIKRISHFIKLPKTIVFSNDRRIHIDELFFERYDY